jgi:hypothetical protein
VVAKEGLWMVMLMIILLVNQGRGTYSLESPSISIYRPWSEYSLIRRGTYTLELPPVSIWCP